MRLKRAAEAIETEYWLPGANYLKIIAKALAGITTAGDIVAISEKALTTAKGRIVDENQIEPGFLAKILARLWIRVVWGYLLGRICHLKNENIHRLRNYSLKEGSPHKRQSSHLWREWNRKGTYCPSYSSGKPSAKQKVRSYKLRRYSRRIN